MPAASPEMRRVAAQIGVISSRNQNDPRLPGLRARLANCRMSEDLKDWAARAAATLPPLVAEVAAIAATIDQRLAAGPGHVSAT